MITYGKQGYGLTRVLGFWVLALIVNPTPLLAHGDTHASINGLTARIDAHADDAPVALYLQRGQHYAEAGHLNEAQLDCLKAVGLQPTNDLAHAQLGRVYVQKKRFVRAEAAFSKAVELAPSVKRHHLEYAWILRKNGNPEAAIKRYQAVLRLSGDDPAPVEAYLEGINAAMEAGCDHLADADAFLAAGFKAYGPILMLQDKAIPLDCWAGRHPQAIARLDRLIEQQARKDKWMEAKAGLLFETGNTAAALDTFQETERIINALPARLLAVPATRERASRVATAILECRQRHPIFTETFAQEETP